MEGTPHLSDTLKQVLSPHQNWVDLRHLKTLACMSVSPRLHLITFAQNELVASAEERRPRRAWNPSFPENREGIIGAVVGKNN
jgi:hypothetical protein